MPRIPSPYDVRVAVIREAAPAPPTLREKMAPRVPGSALWGWLGPLLVTAFAAFLRFDRLGIPRAVVFDETYYAKDAYALLRFGVRALLGARARGAGGQAVPGGQGRPDREGGGSFIAHPPRRASGLL